MSTKKVLPIPHSCFEFCIELPYILDFAVRKWKIPGTDVQILNETSKIRPQIQVIFPAYPDLNENNKKNSNF